MTITLTSALRLAMYLTMIALAVTMTGLSISLVLGAFDTDGATLAVVAVLATMLGFNLALLCVSVAEHRTLRRQHQQAAPVPHY